jgi:hypothetical protein
MKQMMKQIRKPRKYPKIATEKDLKKACKIAEDMCVYPNYENGFSSGKHNFDKKGFCIICGKTKEQVKQR